MFVRKKNKNKTKEVFADVITLRILRRGTSLGCAGAPKVQAPVPLEEGQRQRSDHGREDQVAVEAFWSDVTTRQGRRQAPKTGWCKELRVLPRNPREGAAHGYLDYGPGMPGWGCWPSEL